MVLQAIHANAIGMDQSGICKGSKSKEFGLVASGPNPWRSASASAPSGVIFADANPFEYEVSRARFEFSPYHAALAILQTKDRRIQLRQSIAGDRLLFAIIGGL
jgi:hypothetical protein